MRGSGTHEGSLLWKESETTDGAPVCFPFSKTAYNPATTWLEGSLVLWQVLLYTLVYTAKIRTAITCVISGPSSRLGPPLSPSLGKSQVLRIAKVFACLQLCPEKEIYLIS